MKHVDQVVIGGVSCLIRTAAIFTRAQISRIPLRPMLLAVGSLIDTVMPFSFTEKFCEGNDVHDKIVTIADPFACRPFVGGTKVL